MFKFSLLVWGKQLFYNLLKKDVGVILLKPVYKHLNYVKCTNTFTEKIRVS